MWCCADLPVLLKGLVKVQYHNIGNIGKSLRLEQQCNFINLTEHLRFIILALVKAD